MKVRMVQQMSGPRFDGQEWPPMGGEFEVSDEEGALLCHNPTNGTPIAVPVVEERAVETPEKPDVRAEVREVLVSGEAATAVVPKRGPGRPPGSRAK